MEEEYFVRFYLFRDKKFFGIEKTYFDTDKVNFTEICNKNMFKFLPEEYLNYDGDDASFIMASNEEDNLPKDLRKQIIDELIKHEKIVLVFIKNKTYKICINFCKKNSVELKFVPEKYKTHNLCLICARININICRRAYFPKKYVKFSIFKISSKKSPIETIFFIKEGLELEKYIKIKKSLSYYYF
jgi:hypothetical protein